MVQKLKAEGTQRKELGTDARKVQARSVVRALNEEGVDSLSANAPQHSANAVDPSYLEAFEREHGYSIDISRFTAAENWRRERDKFLHKAKSPSEPRW